MIIAKSSNRRRRSQGGSTLVELALCFLPMLAMMFGIIDFSLVIFLQSSFQHATREAARWAITYQSSYSGPNGSMDCSASQAACIKQAVQDNAAGFLNGTRISYIGVNYYAPDNLSTPLAVGFAPYTTAQGKFIQFVNQPDNIIEVRVNNYPWNWLVPLPQFMVGTGINLNAASSDVLGGLQAGAATPPAP